MGGIDGFQKFRSGVPVVFVVYLLLLCSLTYFFTTGTPLSISVHQQNHLDPALWTIDGWGLVFGFFVLLVFVVKALSAYILRDRLSLSLSLVLPVLAFFGFSAQSGTSALLSLGAYSAVLGFFGAFRNIAMFEILFFSAGSLFALSPVDPGVKAPFLYLGVFFYLLRNDLKKSDGFLFAAQDVLLLLGFLKFRSAFVLSQGAEWWVFGFWIALLGKNILRALSVVNREVSVSEAIRTASGVVVLGVFTLLLLGQQDQKPPEFALNWIVVFAGVSILGSAIIHEAATVLDARKQKFANLFAVLLALGTPGLLSAPLLVLFFLVAFRAGMSGSLVIVLGLNVLVATYLGVRALVLGEETKDTTRGDFGPIRATLFGLFIVFALLGFSVFWTGTIFGGWTTAFGQTSEAPELFFGALGGMVSMEFGKIFENSDGASFWVTCYGVALFFGVLLAAVRFSALSKGRAERLALFLGRLEAIYKKAGFFSRLFYGLNFVSTKVFFVRTPSGLFEVLGASQKKVRQTFSFPFRQNLSLLGSGIRQNALLGWTQEAQMGLVLGATIVVGAVSILFLIFYR